MPADVQLPKLPPVHRITVHGTDYLAIPLVQTDRSGRIYGYTVVSEGHVGTVVSIHQVSDDHGAITLEVS